MNISPTPPRISTALLTGLLAAAAFMSTAASADPVPPQIQNLVAAQRPGTFFVDVTYDLIDPDSTKIYVEVEASSTGGTSYLVPMVSLTGDAGLVTPGTGKKITWNAWNDWAGNYTTNAKVKLIADDTLSAAPPPNVEVPSNLVWIRPGSFNMSGTMVYLTKGFFMAKCELTQAEYGELVTTNPSSFIGPTLPVDCVTWAEAVNYCTLLTARESAAGRLPAGYVYRLPTEAEWEYSCRAGTTTTYFFGSDSTNLAFYAWTYTNAQSMTHDVGRKGANRWGLKDIYGNVWEWCSDWYGGLPGGNVSDPTGPSSGSQRVLRGGSWDPIISGCASAYRLGFNPTVQGSSFGFRVVLAPGQ